MTKSLLHTFQLNCGRYPTTEEGFGARSRPKGLEKRWNVPYGIGPIENDFWGHPYRYPSNDPQLFKLVSFGADGKPGGEGENEDLSVSE